MPIEDWIIAPGEAWAGLPIEAKVLHWKWYLMDFYKQNKVSSKGSITNKSNDILHTVNPDDWLVRPSVIPAKSPAEKPLKPIGFWGTEIYSPKVLNAWFTDGSTATVGNKVHWKAAAYRPEDGQIITDQGTEKSAQHAEVIATVLAVRQTIKEGKKPNNDIHRFIVCCKWNSNMVRKMETNRMEN